MKYFFQLNYNLPTKGLMNFGLTTPLHSEHYTHSGFTSRLWIVKYKMRGGGGLGNGWIGSQLRPGNGDSRGIEDRTMYAQGSGGSSPLPQGRGDDGRFFNHFGSCS